MPALRRPEFIALFALITAMTALSIDAMLPGLRAIGADLGASDVRQTQMIITLFIFGMVFGELCFGPLSDAWGRKRALLLGLGIYAAGTVIALCAGSLEWLLIGRVIQGIGVAGPKIASRALIRDQYKGAAMAQVMSLIYGIFILVPMIAPLLGQLLIHLAGWRSIFGLFLGAAIIVALWLGLRQPETLPLERRIPIAFGTLVRNAGRIVQHPHVLTYTLVVSGVFSAKLYYLSTAQALFYDRFDIDTDFPLYFSALALAIGLAFFANSQLVERFGMFTMSLTALSGMTVLSISILIWLSVGDPGLWGFMTIWFGMFFCVGILFGNLNALAMEWLGSLAGLGASLISAVSSLIAVIVSSFTGQFYDGSLLPMSVLYLCVGVFGVVMLLNIKSRIARDVVPV